MLGGGGPRVLRLAAREAEIIGLLPMMSARGRPIWREASDEATARKVAIVRAAAESRFDELELSVFVGDCGLVSTRTPGSRSLAAAAKSVAPRLIGGSPYLLFGTRLALREELLRRREATGISYYVISSRRMEEMAPLVDELAGR
jgi:alkanesulfonate monooxygenase SsuD/methylene tetrahydromethanopterin reductase-like flavin-dependent oxidoreductase (luciferase family)